MSTPHDALFRFTFRHGEHAESLLLFLLPGVLAGAVEPASLVAVPATTADPDLRLHHADVLFQAKVRGIEAPVFFLMEHKSGPDPALVRQLLRYTVHLVNEWQREHSTLPHVVPLVLHHGRRRMTAARWRAVKLRGHEATVVGALARFDPDLTLLLDDLSLCSESQLLQQPLTPLARLTRLCLRFVPHRGDSAAIAALRRWGDLIRLVEAAQGGQSAMEALSSYFLHVTDLPAERLAMEIAHIVQKPTEGSVMSTADKLIAKGRAEGRAEGRTDLVLRQLAARFGPLPAELEVRVRGAAPEDLDRWALRILDARSLAEVFAHQ